MARPTTTHGEMQCYDFGKLSQHQCTDGDKDAWQPTVVHAAGSGRRGAFMDMGTHAVHRLISVLGPVEKVMVTIGNAAGIYPDVDDHGIA